MWSIGDPESFFDHQNLVKLVHHEPADTHHVVGVRRNL
jgi:hypothetical protein